jgi:hypothetical protein
VDDVTESDVDARQRLQAELMNTESLLWCGRPLRRIIFHPSDWYLVPFSLLWGGFAIFWECGVLGIGFLGHRQVHGELNFFVLWGIPFVLAGQYLIWGRFIYDYWRKGRVFYGVTDRRVLILIEGSTRKVIDSSLRALVSVDLTLRKDGAGTVSFLGHPAFSLATFPLRRTNIGLNLASLVFFDIPNARYAYEVIRDNREHEVQPSSRGILR